MNAGEDASEDVERRLHWFRYARELGQEDDFRALLDSVRREGADEARRQMQAERDAT